MKKFNVTPDEQISAEVAQHSQERLRLTTRGKEKIRSKHASIIKKYTPKAKSILCIGCRDDSEVTDFKKAGFQSLGVDVSNETKLIKKADAHKLSDVFKPNQFDFVYASHCLEHMYDANLALDQIRKVTKLGIFLILPMGKSKDGTDRTAVSINHCSIFDIMVSPKYTLEELKKGHPVLDDFRSLGEFSVDYCRYDDKSVELLLNFKNP